MKRIAVLLVALITIFSVMSSTGVFALASSDGFYDYSNPATVGNKHITSDVIVENYLSEKISDEEKEYLRQYGCVSIKYDDAISTEYVICEYSDETLRVSALPYAYTTADGKDIRWIPVSVTVGERQSLLVSDGRYYAAEVFGVAEDDSLTADIKYVLDVEITEDDISKILNQAYTDAPEWARRLTEYKEEYERLLAEYNENVIKHTEYLEALAKYDEDIILYNEYLVIKKKYDDAKAEYDKYVIEREAYDLALDEYNSYVDDLMTYNTQYSEYVAYLNALEKYEADIVIYREKMAALERVRSQLSIVDAAFLKMTALDGGRTVYSAIKGTLVDSVIAEKEGLTSPNIGAKIDVLEAAEESTENLRALLDNYYVLKTEGDKYAYYTLNYEELKANFIKLAQALDELYNNQRVRALIRGEGKDEKYQILVAQLVLISDALSDNPIYSYKGKYILNLSYKMAGQDKTVLQILENERYIEEGINPTPDEGGYPIVGNEPTLPDEKTEPTPPTPVREPIPPEAVDDPGEAPNVVNKPVCPNKVDEPIQPVEYVPEEKIAALVEAYREGRLSERDMPNGSFTYQAEKIVKKKLFNVEEAIVVFYGTNGEELYSTKVDAGTCATFVGSLPTMEEDASATYSFIGWGSLDGEVYDISSVHSDLKLYPIFQTNVKNYKVTFVIDGEKVEVTFPFGEKPNLGYEPCKPDDSMKTYTFAGWSPAIDSSTTVTKDTVYTAKFKGEYIVPLSNGGAEISLENDVYTVDCTKTTVPHFDLSKLVERAVESRASIFLKSSFCNVEIPYSTLILMQNENNTLVTCKIARIGNEGYTYNVSVSDLNGVSADEAFKVSVSVACDIVDLGSHVLFVYGADGVRNKIRFSQNNGKLFFTFNANQTCTFVPEYNVNVINTFAGNLSISLTNALVGDKVLLSYEMSPGYRFIGYEVFGPNGEKISVLDNSFVMPSYDVSVTIAWEEATYKIVFKDGNRVLSEMICMHGEMPKPPTSVYKLNDSEYSYTFKGWSDTISAADSDKVYYAVFDAVPIPTDPMPDASKTDSRLKRLLIALDVAIAMIFVVVIPSFISLCILLFNDRKRRIRSKQK